MLHELPEQKVVAQVGRLRGRAHLRRVAPIGRARLGPLKRTAARDVVGVRLLQPGRQALVVPGAQQLMRKAVRDLMGDEVGQCHLALDDLARRRHEAVLRHLRAAQKYVSREWHVVEPGGPVVAHEKEEAPPAGIADENGVVPPGPIVRRCREPLPRLRDHGARFFLRERQVRVKRQPGVAGRPREARAGMPQEQRLRATEHDQSQHSPSGPAPQSLHGAIDEPGLGGGKPEACAPGPRRPSGAKSRGVIALVKCGWRR